MCVAPSSSLERHRREGLCTQRAFYFSGVLMDIFHVSSDLSLDSQCSIWHLKDYTINPAGVGLQLSQ